MLISIGFIVFFDTLKDPDPLRGRASRVQGECKYPKSQVGPPWGPPIIKTELRTYNSKRHIVVVVIVVVVVLVVIVVAVAVVVDPTR